MHKRTLEEIYSEVRGIPPKERLKLAARILNDLTVQYSTEGKAVAPDGRPIWQDLLELSERAGQSGVDLPEDLAEQHDHYLYGTPKR